MPIALHRKKFIGYAIIVVVASLGFFWVFNISGTVAISANQWYLNDKTEQTVNIGWKGMWDSYCKAKNDNSMRVVKVAIIDSGIDKNNPEISQCVLDTENNCVDEIGHGTKIAGIICANQYSGKVSGIADIKQVGLFPIKVINNTDYEEPTCKIEDLIESILLAEAEGCDICNISLNIDYGSELLKKTICESSMLFVVSAGNNYPRGRNIDIEPSYPASYDLKNLITVTNIKSNGRIHSTANYGTCVDIAAPGTEIYNISLNSSYSASTGTSFATPIITGLASMLYICDENMTAENCKEIILQSADQERRLKEKVKDNRVANLDVALKKCLKL